ncbi:hypothetical protein PpBr36_08937 [Pyricularia pennisetigena]|uniref:hypothetical protein n=1 Tax=Pyricularia pennisetigena TaxID=1578925 RepID=UPI00114D8755|nr:hypothetical protein PpBr36_08937 [Pyricularia pennisetigena]TLS24579.1 hypothetical protein PpBr36_08937 [Pyricularia pennisetigena]
MNAPQLFRRTTPFVCRACRAARSRHEHAGSTPATAAAARLIRHFSSRPAAARAATTFQSYSLPSHPPAARPRNADVSVETSITQPIEMPPLPRVHDTRPPQDAGARGSAGGQLEGAEGEKAVIPEAEAQESKEGFVSREAAAQQDQKQQQQQQSSTASPAAATQPTTAEVKTASAGAAPRKSRLRAPRKAAMKLTPAAVEQLRRLLDQPEPKLIKVGVRNRGCSGLAYHLEFVDKPGPFDETVEQDGVKVLIDSKALFSIIGSEMDWIEDKLSQRFFFRNPNIKEECGCGESFMTPSPAQPRTDFSMVECPICNRSVRATAINSHIDSGCETGLVDNEGNGRNSSPPVADGGNGGSVPSSTANNPPSATQKRSASTFFQTPAAKRHANSNTKAVAASVPAKTNGTKRTFDEGPGQRSPGEHNHADASVFAFASTTTAGPSSKRVKPNRAAPLAERMRPRTLDEVYGQDLVGPSGVLRSLIDSDRVPSMILWGGSGTGKTTIARCIAQTVGSRFVELNATSTGVNECKKLFQEAASELGLTGRRTIIFCDEIHRFNRAQQDVFLKPVEAGTITLIGATTENPSFRVQSALLSRCRTFTLAKLTSEDVQRILVRALDEEQKAAGDEAQPASPLIDAEMIAYLANFADGDARTALNLLELALSLTRPRIDGDGDVAAGPVALTKEDVKNALTKTLVYDRAGDQHYDNISAFHKSIRGSDPDAALYYLARMLQSGEDPLFIARRLVVVASEDVGLADNTLLPLATAAYTAAQQIGLPEARIPLAHATVALCLAPKSTRAYRGLNNAFAALREPGVAALPVPVHLRNAPTRLMREMGYGAEYKYNPNYKDGKVKQQYLPDDLVGRRFLEDRDLGTEIDPDLGEDGG